MTNSSMRHILTATLCVASVAAMVPTAIYAQISSATRSAHAWIDKDTNHQVIQLTLEPGSKGLYFNENAFTPDGKQMVYIAGQNIKAMELATYKTRLVAAGPFSALAVAHTSAAVYFTRPGDTGLYLAGINTERIIKIADLPARATIDSLNADDTLAAGTYTETDVPEFSLDPSLKASSVRAARADARLAAHIPMVLFTVDLKTGKVQTVLKSTDWISHVQFSPKDTHLLMYCHEGLWYKVDRIWTVRTDGNNNRLIHQRTVNGEIAGHEFWDADGVTIWYDLQIPRGQNFYLASYNTDTGARKWYSVERDAWSIHYNATADDKLFCGDGGDYAQVAKSKNGQWIELLSPRESPVPTEIDQTTLVQSGFMVSKHLVNMSRQDYSLEPNVRFSPDKKWVIFSSNMSGSSYVYAVEVAEAATATTP